MVLGPRIREGHEDELYHDLNIFNLDDSSTLHVLRELKESWKHQPQDVGAQEIGKNGASHNENKTVKEDTEWLI